MSTSGDDSILSRLDVVCEQFELAWQRGERPDILAYLEDWRGEHRRSLFRMLLELDIDYHRKHRLPVPTDTYRGRFAEYATDIRDSLVADGVIDGGTLAGSPELRDTHPPGETRVSQAKNPAGSGHSIDRRRVEQAVNQLVSDLGLQHQKSVGVGNSLKKGKAEGVTLGNYVLLEMIGAGGMGKVFKAKHRRMDRIVALKVLPPDAFENQEMVERFHKEAKTAAKLHHPNVVTAYDADETDGIHFLVMEYVEGRDLKNVIESDGPLDLDKAIDYIIKAGQGLKYAHEQGVIHRDIKPANLLLDLEGNVKILDMGVARVGAEPGSIGEDSNLTQTGSMMGTVDYMSPEQAMDTKTADERSDIYSLGCTLYYLIAGKTLYGGDSMVAKLMAHRDHGIPPLQGARKGVPRALDEFYQTMVAKDPQKRYQNMGDVIRDLEELRTKLAGQLTPKPAPAADSAASARAAGSGRPLRAAVLGLFLAGGTFLLAYLYMNGLLAFGPARVQIHLTEPGALIFILDEKNVSQKTVSSTGEMEEVELPAGKYAVMVSKAGFATYREELELRAGETRQVHIGLQPER